MKLDKACMQFVVKISQAMTYSFLSRDIFSNPGIRKDISGISRIFERSKLIHGIVTMSLYPWDNHQISLHEKYLS